jgi:hypothetical protein
MSRELPSKPNLEYLRKQAKSLQRSVPGRKLADAQQLVANDYGFASWAKLKSFVLQQQLSPAEALKLAVCDSNAQAVEDVLNRYAELRAIIDEPLPGYGFGQHALFAAVQRSDRAAIDILLRFGANITKRTEWWAGGFDRGALYRRRIRRIRQSFSASLAKRGYPNRSHRIGGSHLRGVSAPPEELGSLAGDCVDGASRGD